MDINELFNSSEEDSGIQSNSVQPRICISESLEYIPLIYGLRNDIIKNDFQISFNPPAESANLIRNGAAELGIIPAIDYARGKETWNIVPGICISARGSQRKLQLFFKKGLKGINSIAIDKNAISEKILLQILMREKYMMNPEYIQMDPDLDRMLAKADAALITGEPALKYFRSNRNRLDLCEEWHDLTNLPYVIAFWAGRQFTIKPQDIDIIKRSYEVGNRNIQEISKEYAESKPENWVFYHDFLTQDISYQFSEDAIDGLMEYFNYAFYYGYIKHIPDLHFY